MSAPTAQDLYRLTPLQHGMLFHELYEPESHLYVEQIMIPFAGTLRWPAFTAAWQDLADHHDALRTSFHWKQISTPVQVVHDRVRLPVTAVDLHACGRSPEDYLAADRRAGFALDRPPLFRVALLRAGADDVRLVLSFHHIILDGWSLQLLFRDFGLAYDARLDGRAPELPRPGRYRDYLVWLAEQDLASAEAFWRAHLRGYAGPSPIWSEPDDGGGEVTFGDHEVVVSRELTAAITSAAGRHRITVGTLAHAAWVLAIGATVGSSDVVVGVTVAGRPAELPGADATVGLFINTIPVRTLIAPTEAVGPWLRRVQGDLLRAREHQHTPLVLAQQWSDVPAGSRLFDNILAFENYPIHGRRPEGAAVTATFAERTNYPLNAVVVPGEQLRLRVIHDRRHLGIQAVRRIAARFELLVAGLAGDGATTVGELTTLTDSDREAIASLNATHRPFEESATVADAFAAQARLRPDALALEFGERRVTYAGLAQQAAEVARRLRAAGVGRERRVALLLDRSPELVVAMLATLEAAATYVPLDTASPPARLATIVADTGAIVVVTTTGLDGVAQQLDTPVVHLDNLAAVPEPNGERRGRSAGDAQPLDAAYVMYTSGSTGRPKGIAITHRAIMRLVTGTDYLQLGPTDRVGHLSNVAFDAATFEVWGPLVNGGTVVGVDQAPTPDGLAELVRSRRLTALFLTTALFNRIAADRPDAFAPLGCVLFGGEAVDTASVRRVLAAGRPERLLHVYGPTESTTFATWHEVDEVDDGTTTIPIGRPLANTTGHVLDAAMKPVPLGAVGELHIGGDGLAIGYLGHPGLTADAFRPDPFSAVPGARIYRTGDRVRLVPAGFEFVGRRDHQIKLRGFRIELGEVEHVLRAHPDVSGDCLVDLVSDAGGDGLLVAYLAAPAADEERLRAELGQLLRERLPRYMHPARLVILGELPLNANGKVDRAALRGLLADDRATGRPLVAPRTTTEQRLAVIWRDVLGLESVGVHDDFFESGGHSLRATQLLSRMRVAFDAELSLREVFEAGTIEQLAARLDGAGTAGLAGRAGETGNAGSVAPMTSIIRHERLRELAPDDEGTGA
jgi:amino acid adenylation domain-containing protein